MIIEVDECNFVSDCSYQLGDGNEHKGMQGHKEKRTNFSFLGLTK